MRRHGDLWTKILDKDNIYAAYEAARKGKRWQNTVQRFENDLDQNLERIRQSLLHKSFTTSPYKEKMIYEPKKRIIYKLPFSPDRIVQHALMNVIEPIWDALFIKDSYACRKQKGIHAGSRRTMELVRKYRYCLKLDIRKFYPCVDHDILYEIIRKKIKCPDTLWLLKDIVYSYPGGKNVPIGNYTSQWFGNLYLNEMDQWLKQQHRVKAYLRYCDDFCLFHNEKPWLNEMAGKIERFLADRLALQLSKCDLFPVSRGVDFLGYRHFPRYVLVRKRTKKRIQKRLRDLPRMLRKGAISSESYRSSIASTLGWLKWANAYHLRKCLKIDELQRMIHCAEQKAI